MILNDATLPSMSEPDSATAIDAASSAPVPEPAAVCGASLTEVTVMLAVAGVAVGLCDVSVAGAADGGGCPLGVVLDGFEHGRLLGQVRLVS